MPLSLSDSEQAMASGAQGEGTAMAMRIVIGAARLLGAERLVPIDSAHIDGALYHGDSGTLFAERLVDAGARVGVRATLNVGALDLIGCSRVRLAGHERDMARRLIRAHERMGCEAMLTCAPYQAGHRPQAGSDVAWGESNAVAFCNSVLGARTNRYGDFLDIACAIAARAPYCGLHRPENRRATFVLDVSGLTAELRRAAVFWPVLGSLYGRLAGDRVGAITGLAGLAGEDKLKALCAAAASTGAVGLVHVVGVTPEAPDLAAVAAGPDLPTTAMTPDMVAAARTALSTTTDAAIDAVAIGSPHLSLDEVATLAGALAGRRLVRPLYACTGRHVIRAIEADGRRAALEALGVIFVADTCVVVTPILPEGSGVLMTNSGKFAHYTPGNTGYAVVYGSLEECVEAAVAGRFTPEARTWR